MLHHRKPHKSSQRRYRNPHPAPSSKPSAAFFFRPGPLHRYLCGLLGVHRPLRQKHDLPAPAADRHVRKDPFLLGAAKQLFGKSRQAFRIGMYSGLDRRVHSSAFAFFVSEPLASGSESSSLATVSCATTASGAPFAGNASAPECCRSFSRSIFRSTSRGSVPSASSAALRLIPLFSRFFNSRLRTASVARFSRRLTVASCTRSSFPISASVLPSR